MERIDLGLFPMISRWSRLEVKYMGRSYFIIPEVLIPFSTLLQDEPTLDTITVPPIEGPIEDFINSLYGGVLQVNADNSVFYYVIGATLEIEQLTKACSDFLFEKSEAVVFDVALKLSDQGSLPSELLSYICQHFDSILELPSVNLMSSALYEQIRHCDEFRINDAQKVGKFLINRLAEDSSFSSCVAIHLNTFELPELKPLLWNTPTISIEPFRELLIPFYPKKPVENPVLFEGEYFRGVANYFGERDDCEPYETYYLHVSSSSEFSQTYSHNNVLKYKDTESYFCSNEPTNPASYIMLTLQNYSMRLTSYVIQANTTAKGRIGPISWTFEGTTGEQDWKVLDKHVNDTTIVDNEGPVVFHLPKPSKIFTRFRFCQIENNAQKNKRLIIKKLEIFGILRQH